MIDNNQNTVDFWLRLDNAAKIYPAITNHELTSVFRASVELKERIIARKLLEAVHALENRFPYYKVKLRAGFFWYYLDSDNSPIPVISDLKSPCRAFGKNELLFRVLAKEKVISVEFSHILTDGTGALEFLKSLIYIYLEKCGISVPQELSFHHAGVRPDKEEHEDAFKRYFRKIDAPQLKLPKAFHLPFQLKRKPRFEVLTAIVPLDAILKQARQFEVSLNEYLVSIFLYSLQNIFEQQSKFKKRVASKVLRVQVPVNLRRLFPSKTMRNFSLFVLPEIDLRLGHYSFEEIIKTVYHQLRLETDKKLISKTISRNVGGEKKAFVRILPLFIKSLFLSRLYKIRSRQYSGVLTNLGKIEIDPLVNGFIDKFIFIPPPPNNVLKVNCAVAGFNNNLALSFGNTTESKELERQFLTFLTSRGIAVKIMKHGR